MSDSLSRRKLTTTERPLIQKIFGTLLIFTYKQRRMGLKIMREWMVNVPVLFSTKQFSTFQHILEIENTLGPVYNGQFNS